MSDRGDPPRKPTDRREKADPTSSPRESSNRRGAKVKVRILTRALNPTAWETAIRSVGMTPEEWEKLPPSSPEEGPQEDLRPIQSELFPGPLSTSDESPRSTSIGPSTPPPPGSRREPLPENNDALNLVAKAKLAQVTTPEPRHLYVLQLIDWALVRGELEWPPVPHVREFGREILDRLLIAKSAKAWAWLLDRGLSPEEDAHMGLDPDALKDLRPVDVAAELLESFCGRVIEETSEGADVMADY